jgi:hypothetical protein
VTADSDNALYISRNLEENILNVLTTKKYYVSKDRFAYPDLNIAQCAHELKHHMLLINT